MCPPSVTPLHTTTTTATTVLMRGDVIIQVRSLTLDEWKPTLVDLMEHIGNDRANAIWEHELAAMEGTTSFKYTTRGSR